MSLSTTCLCGLTRATRGTGEGHVARGTADTCHDDGCRFWFNFTVENVHTDQRIIFNIVNLSKSKNLFRLGLTPLVRSTSRPKW